jgi:hypothetical protein
MKDSTNTHNLQEIVKAIDISPQKTVLLNGKHFGEEFNNPYMQQASNKMLFQSIENVIYTVFYSRNKQVFHVEMPPPDYHETQQFVQALSRANTSHESFDGGWIIEQVDMQGQITAQKGNLKRLVHPGEFLNDSGFHQKPAANSHIRLIARKEYKEVNSGFYYVFSSTLGEDNYDQYVRIYFNIRPDGAAPLIGAITSILNEYLVPFNFKCLNQPSLFARCDTAVLYFEKRYSDIIFHLLPEIVRPIKPYLKEETPMFTKALGKGIAFAENPLKQDESFGTHCSKMIAQGIMQAIQKSLNKQQWSEEIKNNIRQRHHYTDIEKLYLNPATKYPYSFPSLS